MLMFLNPQDKPILSDRTQTADRLKIEAKFAQILPRELLKTSIIPGAKLIIKDKEITAKLETQVKVAIAKIVADNCWGLWLAGMSHGRNHAMRELKMVGYGTAKFALVNDKPPSRIQNKQAEKAIWTRNNILAGNVADTEWLRIQGSLKESVQGDIGRDELVEAIASNLGGERFIARSRAIARTELTFAYNAGRIETYRENNVEAIRRYCIRDERTCEQCSSLNGVVARLDDAAAVAKITPASHTNCRCTVSPVIDIKQLAEANRQLPSQAKEPWLMKEIIKAIVS